MLPLPPRRLWVLAVTLILSALPGRAQTAPAVPPASAAPAPDGLTRLLRFPTTDGNRIVFVYAGELYTVGRDGGTARRLSSGPGYSSFPRLSPDGAQLAFTSHYDGNTEIYSMPADGGAPPRRLTTTATLRRDDISDRMGPNNIVLGWRNSAPEIVFRSRMRSFNDFIGNLFTVGPDAELPRPLPVPRGGFMSFSPDDSKMAYNRVFREFRTWKRYRGGMADDVWIRDFKTGTTENLTNHPAQDICPMWGPDNRVYFASDRDGRMNLFATDLATKETRQLTTFKDFDVKFPSLGRGMIVFEQAGMIWRLDLADGRCAPVPIVVKEDFASGRGARVDAGKHLQSVRPAPDGKRVIAVARGEMFSVPAKDGSPRPLSPNSGAHERDAVWSPDGKWIAYVSDVSGENELYVRAQDGRGEPRQVTRGADTYFYRPAWSPDSRKLLWGDRLQRLRIVDIESGAVTEVDRNPVAEIREYAWSPDSQWVAWTRDEDHSLSKVMLFSAATGKRLEATDGWYASGRPAFSDDGKFLLLVSARDFRATFGAQEFANVYRDMERVYLLPLAKATANPLAPRSDEVGQKDEDEAKKAEDADKKKDDPAAAKRPASPPPVVVDEDGLRDRLVALKTPAGNYRGLRLVDGRVFYLRRTAADEVDTGDPDDGDPGDDGPDDARKSALCAYNLKERKETVLGRVNTFEITAEGKKMLVKIGKEHGIIDLPKDKVEIKDHVLKLAGLDANVDRHAEWRQIYFEAWRQMRDFVYAPNMHGTDWPGLRDRYAALLPHVNHRNDLTYLIGELIGELNLGHAYVGGGERPETPRIPLGLLGAEFSRDPATRAYRVERILPGENWDEATRSPLTVPGVDVKRGDYLLAVNGVPVAKLANLFEALVGTAGRQVTLRVNSRPTDDGARDVVVVPTADESSLYYLAWVRENREYVARKTGGKVGYLHIPNMGRAGLNEFTKAFFPQIRKSAMVVDVRGNGGGFVSPLVIERLRRALVMVGMGRNGTPQTDPPHVFLGPLVTLMDEFSASDGDIFPFRFKTMGMGKLVGKRSWGGVVGIREPLPLADGGQLFRPEFAPYAADGSGWIIEGYGVDPDIVVDNDPAREFRGEDQQLDKAIEVILEELKTKGRELPPIPPYPNRSR